MGCNCGKKSRQQKLQQQVQAAKAKQSTTTQTTGVKAADYLKAQQQLKNKK